MQCHHWLPDEAMSEERAQKPHTYMCHYHHLASAPNWLTQLVLMEQAIRGTSIQIWVATIIGISDFVTNSYGESWDSSCEKSGVTVQNQ